MTDKKVFSLILLPMLALTLILGLFVLTSPIRASAGASASPQTGLTVWNPLRAAQATTPGVDGLMPAANVPAVPEVCTPDTTSMISYWPLDEISGTAFTDVVDGNHGACSDPHCPTPATGKVGGAQQFATSQLDGIVITESPGNELTWANGDSFSFEMWVNFTEACGTEAVPNKAFIGRWRNVLGDAQWWVGCAPGGFPAFSLRDDQTGGPSNVVQITDDVAINDGAWHHVVAVRDAGTDTNRLYVDGVEVTSGAASYNGGFSSTGVISLGYYANSYYFDGTLDEVAVYDKALSETEISNHFNNGNGQTYCNDAPTAVDDDLATVEETDLGFTAADLLANDTDPDGNLLTIGAIDSTSTEGGTISDLGAGNYQYSPPAGFAGTDTFGYTASDGNGGADTAVVTVTVALVNDPPVADDQSVTTDEDLAVNITLTATDPDGDSLTFEVVDGPVNGVLSGNAPDLTYTPDPGYNGSDSFTFKANDGSVVSNTATVSITVNPVNDPPVADDQAVTTDEDVAFNITLTATDPEDDPLTYSVVEDPAHGVLTGVAPDLTYTPDADFNGVDSFTFIANDGSLDSNTATVSITVDPVNDPPVADDQVVTTDEDVPVDITLTATDVDGDELTYEVVDGPANGVLTGSGAALTYTPDTGFFGTDSFTFMVNDGTAYSNVATVTITVTPGQPVLFLPLIVKAND